MASGGDLLLTRVPCEGAAQLLDLKNSRLAEVNISPKISISAQPLKMALHRNPAMHGSRMVIFLHDSKKALF